MEPWWVGLLRQQQAAQFADTAGAELSVTLPVSDRLVTRLVADRVPPSWPIKEIELRAAAGNRFAVRLRLTRPSFLPSFTIRLEIEQQPRLPSSPVLVLRIVSDGVGGLASTVMRFLPALPTGLRLEGDRLDVNLAILLARYGAAEALEYVTSIALTTVESRFIVSARAAVPGERRT